QMEKIF
ncbi:hypothetical protein EC34870_5298B, partial [Escherichia coli 3.4870]